MFLLLSDKIVTQFREGEGVDSVREKRERGSEEEGTEGVSE